MYLHLKIGCTKLAATLKKVEFTEFTEWYLREIKCKYKYLHTKYIEKRRETSIKLIESLKDLFVKIV